MFNPLSFLILYFPLPEILAIRLIDDRILVVKYIIPPWTSGPPPHWHEVHDETFLVTKDTLRFHVPEAPGLKANIVDAKAGAYVIFPTRAPHMFSNETDEEAGFFNTFTPVFYIHYFKHLSSLIAEEKELTKEINEQAMYYVTIPV